MNQITRKLQIKAYLLEMSYNDQFINKFYERKIYGWFVTTS